MPESLLQAVDSVAVLAAPRDLRLGLAGHLAAQPERVRLVRHHLAGARLGLDDFGRHWQLGRERREQGAGRSVGRVVALGRRGPPRATLTQHVEARAADEARARRPARLAQVVGVVVRRAHVVEREHPLGRRLVAHLEALVRRYEAPVEAEQRDVVGAPELGARRLLGAGHLVVAAHQLEPDELQRKSVGCGATVRAQCGRARVLTHLKLVRILVQVALENRRVFLAHARGGQGIEKFGQTFHFGPVPVGLAT